MPEERKGWWHRSRERAARLLAAWNDPVPGRLVDLTDALRRHFACPLADLPIYAADFAVAERPNLQGAIDRLVAESGAPAEWVGVASSGERYAVSFSEIAAPSRRALHYGEMPSGGPVEYLTIDFQDGNQIAGALIRELLRKAALFSADD